MLRNIIFIFAFTSINVPHEAINVYLRPLAFHQRSVCVLFAVCYAISQPFAMVSAMAAAMAHAMADAMV